MGVGGGGGCVKQVNLYESYCAVFSSSFFFFFFFFLSFFLSLIFNFIIIITCKEIYSPVSIIIINKS